MNRNSKGQFIKGHTLTQGEKNPFFNKKHSKKTKKIMSKNNSKYWLGKEQPQELNQKRSNKLKGRISPMKNKQHSKETIEKIKHSNLGQKRSFETKKRCRLAKIKYLEKCKKNNIPLSPTIGKNETKILDKIAKCIGYKIIRQYKANGYFLDGYIPELKLAIEVDEKYHIQNAIKDIQRENNIKEELNCTFVRIKDY